MQMKAERPAKKTPLSTAPKTSAAVRRRLIGMTDRVAVDGKGGCNEAWAVIEDRSLRRSERRSDVSSRVQSYRIPLFRACALVVKRRSVAPTRAARRHLLSEL